MAVRFESSSGCSGFARLVLLFTFFFANEPSAFGTILRFNTSLGNIDVRMFDTATPMSVSNFLNYVHDDDLDRSFFHRMPRAFDDYENVGTFVLQGGGFSYSDAQGVRSVPTDDPVVNEPGISNLKYTLAYAKMGGDPNSATSGFFFNTQDNANNLDAQNGGFTVFGRLVGGFGVLDAIADLNAYDLDPDPPPPQPPARTFDNVPLKGVDGTLEELLVYLLDVNPRMLADGDYNFDGDVNLADYSLWRDSLGSMTDVRADGNGNGVVDAADYGVWAAEFGLTPTMRGDYNFDGQVDIADYTAWRDNRGSTVSLYADGDGNGIVDEGDLLVWRQNYGELAAGLVEAAHAATVPEPASASIAGLACLMFVAYGAKKRASNEPDTR